MITNNINTGASDDLLNEFLSQNGGDPDTPLGGLTETETKPTVNSTEGNQPDLVNEFTKQFETPEEDDVEDEEEDETEEGASTETEETAATEETSTEGAEGAEDGEYSFKALASFLSDEGIIDFEDSEEVADTPEVLFESVKKTIEAEINAYKESIPEVGQQFLEYLEKGGDPSKFIQAVQEPLDFKSLDLEDVDTQKSVVAEYLKSQDYTQDEIDDLLTDYEESLILEKQAKLAAKKLEKVHEKRREELIREQEAINEANQRQAQEQLNKLTQTIDSADSFAGLQMSKKDKDEFKAYLFQRDKTGLTPYERELQEDPVKTQLELAFLKFKKFDFTKVAKRAESAAATKIFKKISKNETTVKGKSNEVDLKDKANFEAFASMFGGGK